MRSQPQSGAGFFATFTLIETKRRFEMATVMCPECEAEIVLDSEVEESEIIVCPDCGVELEVVSVDPLEVDVAPEVEEDWGE